MPSPLDELKKAPDAFADPYADLPHDYSVPSDSVASEKASNEAFQSVPHPRQQRLNRFKAEDLADRGIPAYRNASGDVTALTDESGAALSGFDSRHNVAYDSKGEPREISYGETGPPTLEDPFRNLPARTDPTTGDISKQGKGLYQYLGRDPVIEQANLQKEKDKSIQKESALLGRKLSLDEHDLTTGTKEHKALTESLQAQVPALQALDASGQSKYAGADHGTIAKVIDESFDAEYASPAANATTGFFGNGPLTPEATALRADIDQRKAKAHETATGLYDLKDNLNTLTETVGVTREAERANIETLLAHERGEAGPLDAITPLEKAAPGLYPPEKDWGRMGFRAEADHVAVHPRDPAKGIQGAIKSGAVSVGEAAEHGPDIVATTAAAQRLSAQNPKADGTQPPIKTIDGMQATLERIGYEGARGFDKAVEGVARFVGLKGFADYLKARTEKQSQALAGEVVDGEQLSKESGQGASGVASRVAGGFIAQAPGLAAGGIPGLITMATTALGGSSAEARDAAINNGASEADADKAGYKAALKTLPTLALYAGAGKAAGALVKEIMPVGSSPFLRAATQFAVQAPMNMAASAGGKLVVGENPKPTIDSIINDAVFASLGTRDAYTHGRDVKIAQTMVSGEHPEIVIMNGIAANKTGAFKPEMQDLAQIYANRMRAIATEFLKKTGEKIPKASNEAFSEPPPPPPPTGPKAANARVVPPEEGAPPAEGGAPATPKPPTKPKGGGGGEVAPTEPTKASNEAAVKGEAPTSEIVAAEKRFVDEGGHADKLEGQQKLAQLKKDFPNTTDRIAAINERLAPAKASNEASVDVAAHEAATSPKNGLAEPTQAQKEAGNYQKGHVSVAGLDIAIENPAGSRRKPEFAPLQSHYGYIKGTVGADKDHVDVFIKQGTKPDYSGPVYVVNQHNKDGGFDEHKVVMGVSSLADARAEYNANYEKGWSAGKSIVEFKNPGEFKQWVTSTVYQPKGKPAVGFHLPKMVGTAAAELGVSYNGKDAKGRWTFQDTSSERPSGITVVPDTVASVSVQSLRAAVEKARNGGGQGLDDQKIGKLVTGRLMGHKATLKAVGFSHFPTLGKTGNESGIEANDKGVTIDTAKIAEATKGMDEKAQSKFIQRAVDEEVLHLAAIKWEGQAPENEQQLAEWGKEKDDLDKFMAGAYDGWENLSDRQKGHEKLRAVLQKRWTGKLTEAAYRMLKDFLKYLRGIYEKLSDGQRKIVDDVEAILKGEEAARAPPEKASNEAEPKIKQVSDARETAVGVLKPYVNPSKSQKRANGLIERFNAIEGVKPTDTVVIKTLLGSSSKTALDQAESRIAKLENQHAIREPSTAGILQHPPEGAGEQAGGRVQPGEQGTPGAPETRPQGEAEQPSIRQPETAASQELIDKGKKAFEGLFAGLPRYEGQIATKGSQVSEGDVEDLRKSNEGRLKAGWRAAGEEIAARPFEALRAELEAATGEEYSDEAVQAHIDAAGGMMDGGEGYDSLGAAKPVMEQLPIPKEKRTPMFDLIDAMEKEGITTPEKVASYLDAISDGKARPFSQSLWDMMAAAGAVPRGTHDWPTIYAPAKEEKASSDALVRTPAENVTRAVRNKLLTGQSVDRRALTELATGNQVSPKEADEAAEVAIVEVARTIATGEGTTEEKFDKLVDLYNRQPNLTARTSTSKVNQAYSTPAPLAFAASHLADITGNTVYEPTAGNGMLLIEADPAKSIVNELDLARAAALRQAGFEVHTTDATQFAVMGMDRVIANPPFGTVLLDDQSKKEWPLLGTNEMTREIDHAISLKALSGMKDDGRAVLILGGKNKLLTGDARADAYTRGDGAKFWKTLYDQYKVVDQFTLNGDLYTKQGAGWPIDVVVIAGRGKSPIQLPSADGPRILNSWDELRAELNRSDADRIDAGRYDPEKDRARVGGIIGAIRGIAGTDAPPRPEGSPEQPAGQPGTATAGADLARPDSGQQPAVSGGPEPSAVSPAAEPGPVGVGAVAGQPEQSGQLSLAEGFRVPYKPASKLPSFKIFVPTNMEVPAREALARLEAEVGPIDEYVRGKLGYRDDADMGRYFSAEQMDALALGVHAIENQTAFVLGDQGGVGKGRVAAGMMAYAIHQGKLPIFITKDVKLYAAMIEDLHDIGKDDITPMFTDNDIAFVDYAERKWKQGNMTKVMKEIGRTGKLHGAEALFTTYSQIASDLPPKYSASKAERYGMKAKHQAPPDGARMEALKKLAPGSVIISDESHLAAGDSIRAWRLAPLLAQAHGVYYSSATFAKRPDSMGIYSRTSLSHATQSIDDLVDAMKQGGVPLQQVVSATLAADGLYLRRERDFAKAVFRTHINVDTKERDTRLADNYTDGIRSILNISNKMAEARKQINKILRREGKKMHVANAPKIETTNFASKLHNLISQYLFAIKAESMVRRAVEGVTKGFANVDGEVKPHKVIIAFQNTMEQPILALESSKHPLTFNGMLLQYLDSQRILTSGRGNTAQTTTITDKPDTNFENLSDEQLERILIASVVLKDGETTGTVNEPALAELFRRIMAGIFKETAEKLEKLDLADMPLSPIDHIKRQLTLLGIKNAEITKRGTGIDEDGHIYKLHPSSNTKAAHLSYLSDFNNGDTDVLLINASGSTGISAHSSAKFKKQNRAGFGDSAPRAMIIGQPHLDINEFMQTTYRIDRTGQVHQPYYELLQTALSAEARPAAILGKKMSKLNANTTSNAESEISAGNKGTDIFNQYGDEVVYNYLKSDPHFTQMLDMPKIVTEEGNIIPISDAMALYEESGQFAAAVTGRAAVLPEEEARVMWDKVQSDYTAMIDYLNELGENELVSDTVDLKAETIESKELTPAKKGDSGFDAPSQMEKIRADIGMKPLQASEVVTMMKAVDEDVIRDGWTASSDAWKKAELARLQEKVLSWDDEKATAYQARWREQEEEISASLGLIGVGLHIKTDKGMDGYGAITDVQLDPEHPLTPSKQIFTLHVNTTKKTIKVPASQLPTIAREAVGDFEIIYEANAERSNQRYMITGNLLAAYLAIKDAAPTAKIVNYTTDKGDLRQGILMPAKFTPGSLNKKRVVESPKHMLELLLAGRSLNNAGSELTIVKAPSGGFVIRVPASRVMGGAYWRDGQLAKLMEGGEFVERGGAMIGKFGLDNSHLVYQRLLDLQATLFYTEQGEGEALGAARPVRAAVAFKDSVTDALKGSGLTLKESLRMLQHLVSPTTGVAMDANDQVMRMLGERNQKAYQTDRALKAASASFDAFPRPEQVAFIDRMKKGEAQPTPELQAVADAMRKIDTESWEAAVAAYRALGFKEPPLKWLENHYRVLWKKIPGSTDEEKSAWIGKSRRGLRGSMGQHKQHTLETMSDGLDMGGIPYSYNPVTMFKLAQADLWKLTSTLKTWKWAKDNGFVEFVRGAFPKAPDGMVALDDGIANVYFPAESGEGLVHAGKYFVEEGFGRLLNNYLSKDYIRQVRIGRGLLWLKNATTSLELSLSAFHGMFETAEAVGSNIGLGLSKLVNRGLLKGDLSAAAAGVKDIILAGASPFTGNNLGKQIRRAAADPAAFFATPEGLKMERDYPGARQAVNALFVGGWKPNELEQDWKNNSIRTFLDAVADIKAGDSDNYIGAGLRAFPAANEFLMKPLFDHYIPNLKVAQFFKEFLEAKQQNERKLAGGILTEAALARQVWRFVEDRFGEMNFDTLFWNSNFKTAMQLMFRSVTWKLGSVEAFAGAFGGQAKEFRDAFKERRAPELHRNTAWLFGMFLLTATLGAIISQVLGQKKPQNLTDFVFPQIDPKDDKVRVSLPTYFKDAVHLAHSPLNYVVSSMSGWIGRVMDLLRNKDYFGVQIRDTDDPVTKQALAVAKYGGETLLPFSVRGYKNLSAQDVGTLRKLLAVIGINPAPRYISQSTAERKSEAYWKDQRAEGGMKPAQFEKSIEKRKLVTALRHGEQPDIGAALAAGTLKPRDVKPLFQRAQMGALASQVLHMPLEEAERIYAAATAQEKVQLAGVMAKKRANSFKRNKKAFAGF